MFSEKIAFVDSWADRPFPRSSNILRSPPNFAPFFWIAKGKKFGAGTYDLKKKKFKIRTPLVLMLLLWLWLLLFVTRINSSAIEMQSITVSCGATNRAGVRPHGTHTEAPKRQTTNTYEFLIWQMAMIIIIRKTTKMDVVAVVVVVILCFGVYEWVFPVVLRDYGDICNQI